MGPDLATMRSDPKATVRYSIDLLRAHQIRRENLFLHKELQSCRKELEVMRDEIRDLTVSAQNCKPRLDEQRNELENLQRVCETIQTDIGNVKSSCDKTHENAFSRWLLLERQIDIATLQCRNAESVRQQQEQSLLAGVESLRVTVEKKAEASVVDKLKDQIVGLCIPDAAGGLTLDSLSRVQDSFERRNSSCQLDKALIQVQNSQAVHQDETRKCCEPSTPRHLPEPVTVPDDLDLDANANTISYAGHHYHPSKEIDTLQELPRPGVPASQLARIKTLKQRRFDDWEYYSSQAQRLIETLPDEFEETIVRNFTEGIFKNSHRDQCRQWLDLKGWSWENVISFGDLCSQVLAANVQDPIDDLTGTAKLSRGVGEIPVGRAESGQTGYPVISRKTKGSGLRTTRVGKQHSVVRESSDTSATTQHHSGIQQGPGPENFHPGKGLPSGPAVRKAKTRGIPQRVRSRTQLSFEDIDELSLDIDDLRSFNKTKHQGRSLEYNKSCQKTMPVKTVRRKRTADALEIIQSPMEEKTEGRLSKRGKPELKRGVKCDILDSRIEPMTAKRMVLEHEAHSSDDAEYLFERDPVKQHPETAGFRRKGHTMRRLPLPPPPEIPILPSSNED